MNNYYSVHYFLSFWLILYMSSKNSWNYFILINYLQIWIIKDIIILRLAVLRQKIAFFPLFLKHKDVSGKRKYKFLIGGLDSFGWCMLKVGVNLLFCGDWNKFFFFFFWQGRFYKYIFLIVTDNTLVIK